MAGTLNIKKGKLHYVVTVIIQELLSREEQMLVLHLLVHNQAIDHTR